MYTQEQQWALDQFAVLEAQLGSQNKACKQVGISPAIMTPLRKGTYTGDASGQLDALVSYFRIKEEAREIVRYEEQEYVPTRISQLVYEKIRLCHHKGKLAIAHGDAGIGKTMAAEKYVADYPYDAVLITLNPCFTSVKSILKLMCKHLGAQGSSPDDMWLSIAGKLRDGMVIIFDEAQYLPIRTIDTLRDFPDRFQKKKQRLGMVFIGNFEIAERFGECEKRDRDQIRNRTRRGNPLTTELVTREDVHMLFPLLSEPGHEKETEFMLAVARSIEGVRGAVQLFSDAYDNENISYEGLVSMAKNLGLRVLS